MTPQEALDKLNKIIEDYHDPDKPHFEIEEAHIQADQVLVSLIRSLGLNNIVDAYESIDKLYT